MDTDIGLDAVIEREPLQQASSALMKVFVTDYVVATFESVRHFPVSQQE